MRYILSAIGAVCLVGGTLEAAVWTTRTENFDSAGSSSWVESNSRQSVGSPAITNFGFSNTNNTGQGSPAGEAGGITGRSIALAYYADTNVRRTATFLDAFDRLEASGELSLTASGSDAVGSFYYVSFFDRNDSLALNRGMFGFIIDNTTGANFSIGPTAINQGNPTVTVGPGQYKWDFIYDPQFAPAGGGNFNGRLTWNLRNTSGGILNTLVVNVVHGAKQGRSASTGGYFNINSFGIVNGQRASNVADVLEAYIDGVNYTVVPEPAAGLAISMAGLISIRRRHHKP